MGQSLKERYASSALFGGNASYVEFYYEQYLSDPRSVSPAWRSYFEKLAEGAAEETPHGPVQERFRQLGLRNPVPSGGVESHADEKQATVSRLIQTFGLRGHQIADLDPLGLDERHVPQVLKLEYFGLNEGDMDTEFVTGGFAGTDLLPLREILRLVTQIYCGKIGAEFAHVSRARERLWLRKRFEAEAVSMRMSEEGQEEAARQFDRRRGAGALSSYALRRAETFFPGGRRESDSDAGRSDPAGRRFGRRRNRGGHGASRAHQRSGERHGEIARGPVFRVRG